MRYKNILILLVGIITIFAAAGITYASSVNPIAVKGASGFLNSSNNQTILNNAYAFANCWTTFAAVQVNQTVKTIPSLSSNLTPDISTLQNENSQLHTYVTSDNVKGFAAYFHTTYEPGIIYVATSTVENVHYANVSKSTKYSLDLEFLADRSTFFNCTKAPVTNLTNEKLDFYNYVVNKFDIQITALSANGINTTNMTAVVNGGQTQIIQPLQAALSSATNVSQINQALNEYCLFDGCKSGLNYHLDAKFQIAKLDAIDAKLLSEPNITANETLELRNASTQLNNATTILNSVGTSQYSGNQATEIWSQIKTAETDINAAIKSWK
jgi:hypothetical protein